MGPNAAKRLNTRTLCLGLLLLFSSSSSFERRFCRTTRCRWSLSRLHLPAHTETHTHTHTHAHTHMHTHSVTKHEKHASVCTLGMYINTEPQQQRCPLTFHLECFWQIVLYFSFCLPSLVWKNKSILQQHRVRSSQCACVCAVDTQFLLSGDRQ